MQKTGVNNPSNYATLRTRVGIPLNLLTLRKLRLFFICGSLRFLRVFCAEFQVLCFPVLQICRPKPIIPNSGEL